VPYDSAYIYILLFLLIAYKFYNSPQIIILYDKRTRTERKNPTMFLCLSVQSRSVAYLQNVMLLILNVDAFASFIYS